jgi:threonine/homoserine efflux transporter RhtA
VQWHIRTFLFAGFCMQVLKSTHPYACDFIRMRVDATARFHLLTCMAAYIILYRLTHSHTGLFA